MENPNLDGFEIYIPNFKTNFYNPNFKLGVIK